MKTLFLHAKSKEDIEPVLKKIKFKGKLGVLTTVQFLDQVNLFRKKLNQKEAENFIVGGQI